MDERTMIDLSPILVLIWAACFVGGFVLGLAYFRCLRATTDLILRDGEPFLVVALTFGRFAGMGTGLFVAVQAGGVALIVALAGILCAKAWTLRQSREANA